MENVFRIALEPIVDLSTISQLRAACAEALASGSPVVQVDASAVERLKTPVFQLILSLQHSLVSQQRSCTIFKPTEGFKELAECLGLSDIFSYSEAA